MNAFRRIVAMIAIAAIVGVGVSSFTASAHAADIRGTLAGELEKNISGDPWKGAVGPRESVLGDPWKGAVGPREPVLGDPWKGETA
ncbi:hypothetical protein [Streptosporangium sp. NPDC087985]|uniref:hypothetical protein n=1 Tax=Streptosporangium sp. NPDC087985 TaxID=3366196 RepID=UPI003801FB2E